MSLYSIVRVLSLTLALAACGAKGPSFQATDLTGASFGRDFELTAPDGKPRLADFRGKAVVMFSGYTQCPDVARRRSQLSRTR
jgi:protein SCO1/2